MKKSKERESKFRASFDQALLQVERCGGRLVRLSDEEYRPFRIATELLYSGTLVNERVACVGHDFLVRNSDELHPTTRTLFSAVLTRDAKPCDVFTDLIKQTECTRQAQRVFEATDVMILPTVPSHSTIAEMEINPLGLNTHTGEYTHFANVFDLGAVSINATLYEGVHGKMPFGISLVAGMGLDGPLTDIAAHVEEYLAAY